MDPMESCKQFVAITGASEDEALNWLEMTGYVLQDAVDLFFNSGGSDPAAGSSSSRPLKHSYDQSFEDEDNVRLPDQVKRQKLVDTEAYLATQVSKKITSAFTSGKSNKNLSEKEKTLSQLFQAPLDIMTQAGFEEAKELAQSDDKWLLVNIQKDSEFQSHALNRDFWSDECVKDMIMCSFVFWQQQDISPEGATFIAYYKVTAFPHVAIIDPRTGACKWQYKLTGNLVPKLLAEKLQDFLGDNPAPSQCRRQPTLPVASHRNLSNGAGNGSSSSSAASASAGSAIAAAAASLDGDDADAELEEAIRLSLQQAQSSSGGSSSGAPVPVSVFNFPSSSSNISGAGKSGAASKDAVHVPGFNAKEVLQSELHSATSEAGGASVRAQIRLPGNQKVTEKFSTADEVMSLVRVVAKQIPAADADKRFEIHFNFPRQNLSDLLHQHSTEVSHHGGAGADSGNANGVNVLKLSDIGVTTDTAFHVIYL